MAALQALRGIDVTSAIALVAEIGDFSLSAQVRAIGWKAQLRLTGRFAKLCGRGVQKNKVCVAVARELTGFVWAVAQAGGSAQQPGN